MIPRQWFNCWECGRTKALKVARMQFKQANDEFEVVQNQITTGTTDDDQAPLPMEG
jgi:hypothetical protein